MEVNTSMLMKTVAVLLIAAKLVSSQCTVGSTLTTEGEPLSESRQYINLDRPASCKGNITTWHLCYFPRGENRDFEVEFRVWRPLQGSLYERAHSEERTIPSRTGNSNAKLLCEDITLTKEEYFPVEPNDVVGIYIPPSLFTDIAAVGTFGSGSDEVGIHEDTRSSFSTLASTTVRRSDLRNINTAGLYLFADISVTATETVSPPSTNTPASTTNSSPQSSNEPNTTPMTMTTRPPTNTPTPSTIPPSLSPNGNEIEGRDGNSNNNAINTNEQTGGNEGGGNRVAVTTVVVVVVLLLIAAAVVVGIVVLVVCLRDKNKTLSCFKGRRGMLRSIDNLIYRAGSDRIPFDAGKTTESPYDIPRDRHDRTLYDIPKSLPASLTTTANYEIASQSDVTTPAPSLHYLQTESPTDTKPVAEGKGIYDTPKDHKVSTESNVLNSLFDDSEYIYMSHNSGTTERSEEMSRSDDKSTSEEDTDSYSEAYVSISYNSVEYRKLLKKATDDRESGEMSHYSVPPSKEDEIYIVLSKQKIKVIPRNAVSKSGLLGSGEYATVHKGVWEGSKGTKDVAVKTLSDNATDGEKICFLQEAVIMGQFVHPNIVQLYGIITNGDPLMLVLEHMPNGDLKKFLNQLRPEPGQLVPSNTPKLLLGFSQQVALGMHYLASKGFVHRDLAARNVFVSEDNNCKIGDFGMSRDLTDGYYKCNGGKVPLKWTAPEAIRLKKYSIASDVWSYGCLLYEIWSLGRKPFKGISNTEAINKISNGYRLSPPPGCPKSVYELMIRCWHPAPGARPKYREILTVLLDEEQQVLRIPVEDASSSAQASLLGVPIEQGEKMYRDLQVSYLTDFDDKHNPDYEYGEKDGGDH